jgi:excisionase family DNA binding protein
MEVLQRAKEGSFEATRYRSRDVAAQYLCISVRTLDQLTADGRLRPIRIGRRVLFDLVDLDSFAASCKA